MKKNFEPGERFNAFQAKKKKLEEKKHKFAPTNNSRSMGLPGSMSIGSMLPKYSPLKNAESTRPMAKKKAKHMKHKKSGLRPAKVVVNDEQNASHQAYKKHKKAVKTTGKFEGKSNRLGQGGRAAQLKAQGVPGGVIGNLARAAHAAPGQKNFHKKHKKMTQAQDDAYDKKHGIKEGSEEDVKQDERDGVKDKKHAKHKKVMCKTCGK